MKTKLIALVTALLLAVALLTGAMAEGYNLIFVCPIVGLEYGGILYGRLKETD